MGRANRGERPPRERAIGHRRAGPQPIPISEHESEDACRHDGKTSIEANGAVGAHWAGGSSHLHENAPVGIRTRAPGSTGRDHRPLDHRGSGRRKVRSLIILSYRRCEHLPLCLRATDSLVPGALDEQANPSVQRLSFDSPFHLLSARGHVARVDDDSVRTEKPIPPESNESGHCGMRIFRRQAVEHAEGRALKAHLHRNTERQAEVETLQFLLTSIKKRHTWDRIKCTIATGIPAFWILLIALRPYLPTWLHPLLDNVPAIQTAVGIVVAGTMPATARSAARIGTTTERAAAMISRRTARPSAPWIRLRSSGRRPASYRGANRSARIRSSTWEMRTERNTSAGTSWTPSTKACAPTYVAPIARRPMGRILRQRQTTDRMTAAAPIPKMASSAAAHRPSPLADTSRTAHPTSRASVTTGAARNAGGISWGEALCRSPGGRAPTGSRGPNRRPARRVAAARSGCRAPCAGFGGRSGPPAAARRASTRSRAATAKRSRHRIREPPSRSPRSAPRDPGAAK